MTLLVALRGSDGIVVASDSRGTFGDPRGVTAQNDAQKKLYRASKYSSILTAGSGELGATIMAEALGLIQEDDGVSTVLDKTRTLVRAKYDDWFPGFVIQPNEDGDPVRPDLALLVAGYDESGDAPEQKIFQIVSALDFAPMLHNYGFALVGVAQYGLYLLNRLYKDNQNVEQLRALAAYVITETATQDGKVGGPVQMATIKPDEGCRELPQDEIDAIVSKNERKNTSLQDSFFKEP